MYIGIDLGTSNSVIAGVSNGAAQVFRPADGGEALPSAIYIDKRGHRLYGRRAYDQSLISPESVAAGFKRLMGTDTPIEVADQSLTPEECSAEIVRQLIGQAITESGEEKFEGVVVSIPAAFNQMQSEATLRAIKMAGIEHVDLIQEPVAAAMAAMANAKRSGKFIIYDFGGGTFDVALVEAIQGEIKILAQAGVNMLGGRDFDRMIVTKIVRPWLLANFDLPDNFLRDPEYKRLARLAQLAAERAKIDLSVLEEATIFASDDEVRLQDKSEMDIFLDVPITRAQFEELIRVPISNTIDLIASLLEENEIEPSEIDRVVFVGGPSRIPLIRRDVEERLGIEADLKTDPMTAVAEGAAYYCENRQWKDEPSKGLEESVAKPVEAHASMETEPDLSFDYTARTPDERTSITVKAAKDKDDRRIRLMTEGWDSGMLPLEKELRVEVPLNIVGENSFDVQIMDASGSELKDHDTTLKITRLVAAPAAIPAAQTIAVKVRRTADAEENTFENLVEKGAKLPASGQLTMKSATTLKAGSPDHIGFELFQVECGDRVELNLCVGFLRVNGVDLPEGSVLQGGDDIVFDWHVNEGGLLQASVKIPSLGHEVTGQRFYAPQDGQVSYEGEGGQSLAKAVLKRAAEEWGDLAAAIGPQVGPDVSLLKVRLDEQKEILIEDAEDAEDVRRVTEEARFIRQDTVRLGRRYAPELLQRQLGKLTAAFNRVVRGKALEEDKKAFDDLAQHVQGAIDDENESAYATAQMCLAQMRRVFFTAAWRNADYVEAWFKRLTKDTWLFSDEEEHKAMVEEGRKYQEAGDQEALRKLVVRMLDARMSLSASDVVDELATVVRA